MPNAVLEAGAAGPPVVLSVPGNGARLVAKPGVDGVLIPDCSARAWAAAMQPLLAESGRRAGEDGARPTAARGFSS